MKRIVVAVFMMFVAGGVLFAQDDNNKLVVGGELLSNNRVRLNDTLPWSWNENRLDVKLTKKVDGFAKFNGDIWFRYFNFSDNDLINPYYRTDLTVPFSDEIRELNVELYDFLIKNLDITLGRQRIAWGTADKINPTDNLNPYDLSDIWDFGRHLGSDAIDMRYYVGDLKIEGVFMPYFKPYRLPYGDWWQAFETDANLPDTMQIIEKTGIIPPITMNLKYNNLYYNYQLPVNKWSENAMYGAKISKNLWGYDFSLSYMYGRDGLPLPIKTDITVDSLASTLDTAYLSVNTIMMYPRVHIIGFDFAGTIGNFGVWGEAAMFMPDKKYIMEVNAPDPNAMVSSISPFLSGFEFETNPEMKDSVVLDNKPYFRYVLGTDYTFVNGLYLNMQYLHGFINERGQGNLNDYLVFHLEKKFFDDKLAISPADFMVTVSDWNDISNNYAYVWMPTLSYYPTDNAEIKFGSRIIDGKGEGLFSKIKDKDELFISLKYSF